MQSFPSPALTGFAFTDGVDSHSLYSLALLFPLTLLVLFDMSSSKTKSSSSQYAPVSLHDDGEDPSIAFEKRSSDEDEDDHSEPLLESSGNTRDLEQPKPSQLPKLILYLSFAVALLSAVNVALLPATLSRYQAYPFSDSDLEALPYRDARLGLDRLAEFMPPPRVYQHSWPDRIARVSRKLKDAVWGQGVQVYVTVEVRIFRHCFGLIPPKPYPHNSLCLRVCRAAADAKMKDSTIMRFPIPSTGVRTCALSWRPPPEFSGRVKDLETKGDITEVEVWQLIAPSATASASVDELDYDTISYSTLPVRGELLGVLDLTAKPNSTTLEFACPSGSDSLVVEMRCQRVACHISFMQIDIMPRFGFELVRRRE